LTLGPKGSEGDKCNHAGVEPVYLMPADGSKPKKFNDVRIMAEVIKSEHADVPGKWYFYRADLNPQIKGMHPYSDGALVAAELYVDRSADPCELYFGDYKDSGGKMLPGRMEVRNGDKRYAMFNIKVHQMK
jgi:serine protease Do